MVVYSNPLGYRSLKLPMGPNTKNLLILAQFPVGPNTKNMLMHIFPLDQAQQIYSCTYVSPFCTKHKEYAPVHLPIGPRSPICSHNSPVGTHNHMSTHYGCLLLIMSMSRAPGMGGYPSPYATAGRKRRLKGAMAKVPGVCLIRRC
jgi:hypothetical protein